MRDLSVGKSDLIDLAVTCLLAEGHLLIEDVPGVGKSMSAESIARSIRAEVRRMQFTPDLLPSDITGAAIYNPRDHSFEFRCRIDRNLALARGRTVWNRPSARWVYDGAPCVNSARTASKARFGRRYSSTTPLLLKVRGRPSARAVANVRPSQNCQIATPESRGLLRTSLRTVHR
jgi:hypothetical protein